MTRSLNLKPDFLRTAERFEAWWRCELIDRPPVQVGVKPRPPRNPPVKSHATQRDRWLDAEFAVDSALAWLRAQEYVGDSLPIYGPNIGPELTATLYGCELEFSEHSSWSRPVIHDEAGWHDLLGREPDFDNPYWRAMEQMTRLALERAGGDVLVGLTDLHGSFDILAALRDPQTLCMDILDCPGLIARAGMHAAHGFTAALIRNYKLLTAGGQHGSATWTPCYHDGPAYLPNVDFWCMVSHETARDLIVPTIQIEMKPMARSLFHLDGPQALRHLDLVLDLPGLWGVQWVPGDGNGPACRWLDVYRRVLDAGKCVQVLAADPADALAALEHLGPRGVWLCVARPFDSRDAAEAFLRDVERAVPAHA